MRKDPSRSLNGLGLRSTNIFFKYSYARQNPEKKTVEHLGQRGNLFGQGTEVIFEKSNKEGIISFLIYEDPSLDEYIGDMDGF